MLTRSVGTPTVGRHSPRPLEQCWAQDKVRFQHGATCASPMNCVIYIRNGKFVSGEWFLVSTWQKCALQLVRFKKQVRFFCPASALVYTQTENRQSWYSLPLSIYWIWWKLIAYRPSHQPLGRACVLVRVCVCVRARVCVSESTIRMKPYLLCMDLLGNCVDASAAYLCVHQISVLNMCVCVCV